MVIGQDQIILFAIKITYNISFLAFSQFMQNVIVIITNILKQYLFLFLKNYFYTCILK
jgi:hypothetical protein